MGTGEEEVGASTVAEGEIAWIIVLEELKPGGTGFRGLGVEAKMKSEKRDAQSTSNQTTAMTFFFVN